MGSISRERVECVARICATNQDASQTLEITPHSFSRLCRRYGIETPHQRRRRARTRPAWGRVPL